MERIYISFPKRRALEKATRPWREYISNRERGTRSYNLPRPNSKQKIRIALQNVPKTITGRFCQLLSGHALTGPFLKRNRNGRTPTLVGDAKKVDRQGNIFLRSREWEREIHALWEKVGRKGEGGRKGKWSQPSEEQERLRI